MRETSDPVEAEGVAVAHEAAQQADLVLSVLDLTTYLPILFNSTASPAESVETLFGSYPNAIAVLNKADALSPKQIQQLQQQLLAQPTGQLQTQLSTSSRISSSDDILADEQSAATVTTSLPLHADPQAIKAAAAAENSIANSPRGMHPVKAVICSCKTGRHMDKLLNALELGVKGIMESGQDSQEGLIITRQEGFPILSRALPYCADAAAKHSSVCP